jgi:hypothetical protein
MSKTNLIIGEEIIQGVDNVAMTLLTMAECYNLPESVRLMIEELNNRTQSLKAQSWLNEGNGLEIVRIATILPTPHENTGVKAVS